MKFHITSIETNNFRQYRGKQTINLKFNSSKNVIIIKGKNGAGKSNLLNALTWAFYGIETHLDDENNKGMPIINTSVLNDLSNGETTVAEVKIRISTDEGDWTIQRSVCGGKNSLGEKWVDKKGELIIIKQNGLQDKTVKGEETDQLINHLLPAELKSFFFMDGEKLRGFFEQSASENISGAIEKVSQLDLIFKSAEHIELLESELIKGVKSTTPKITKITEDLNSCRSRRDYYQNMLEDTSQELKKDKEELKEILKFLKTCGIDQVEKLSIERDGLEENVRRLKIELEEKISSRNKYLVEIAPIIYLIRDLKETKSLIQDKINKGELPSDIKKSLVEDLIEKGECICCRKIDKKSKEKLLEYSKNLEISELSEISVLGKTVISQMLKDVDEFSEKMDIFHRKISDLEEMIGIKKERIEIITEKLSSLDNKDEIILKENRKKELESSIIRFDQDIKMYSQALEDKNIELNQLNDDLNKELQSEDKNRELKEQLDFVRRSKSFLAEIEKRTKETIRNLIKENTEKNFFRLIRKKDAFKEVTLNEDYEIEVLHNSGYNVLNHLSAGEYMILGLAFMSSLMNISGFKAPVIIDTPLGKIDDEHRERISKELPKFLNGTQLILLVTPTEYDETVKSNLKDFILDGNYQEIKENSKNDESVVKAK